MTPTCSGSGKGTYLPLSIVDCPKCGQLVRCNDKGKMRRHGSGWEDADS